MAKTVDNLSLQYIRMSDAWSLPNDLRGGTRAMRVAGKLWLPREPKEKEDKYELRLNRSVLYNAYGDTLGKLVSKPFSRAVDVVTETILEPQQEIIDDVDQDGLSLTQFASSAFLAGIHYGLTHCLVDFPTQEGTETLADEQANGVRPRLIHVTPEQLIGWKYENQRLVEIRILETQIEDIGGFEQEEAYYVRVIRIDTWELWKKAGDNWSLSSSGVNTFGGVPLFTLYINEQEDRMVASPTMEDLAWMNLAHWQSSSDQRNILRFARCGILHAAGFGSDELSGISWGPNTLVESSDKDAILKHVEHDGKGIDAGAKDLEQLERLMESLGNQPLVERSAQSTATGKAIDDNNSTTDIQSWIRRTETWLTLCFKAAGQWLKQDWDLEFDIFSDFAATILKDTDIKSLIIMREKKQITAETHLKELKRRNFLSGSVDVEAEIEQLDAEKPDLILLDDDNDDDNIDDDIEDTDGE